METVTEKLNQVQGKLIPLAERIREYVGISSGQQDNINKHILISELVKIGEKITRVTEDYKNRADKAKVWNYPLTLNGMADLMAEIDKTEEEMIKNLGKILGDIENLELKMGIIISSN